MRALLQTIQCRRPQSNTKRRRLGSRRFVLESLEYRTLLAGDVGWNTWEQPPCNVDAQQDQVLVVGTTSDDGLFISSTNPDQVGVELECGDTNHDSVVVQAGQIREILFAGRGGDDTIYNLTQIPVVELEDPPANPPDDPDGPPPTPTPEPEPKPRPCQLDLDIHRPRPQVQDGGPSLISEEQDHTVGAHTLRNDDIDASGVALRERITNLTSLRQVTAKSDKLVEGAIPEEDDLVRIDLLNPQNLDPVYLVVYAMTENKKGVIQPKDRPQRTIRGGKELRIWRSADRAGEPVSLPYSMSGSEETLYIEGLKEGRYRLVLMYNPGANPRRVKASEADPHGTSGELTLSPEPECWGHGGRGGYLAAQVTQG